jgi:hypothetical protein
MMEGRAKTDSRVETIDSRKMMEAAGLMLRFSCLSN